MTNYEGRSREEIRASDAALAKCQCRTITVYRDEVPYEHDILCKTCEELRRSWQHPPVNYEE